MTTLLGNRTDFSDVAIALHQQLFCICADLQDTLSGVSLEVKERQWVSRRSFDAQTELNVLVKDLFFIYPSAC